jgi:hypothetical protein
MIIGLVIFFVVQLNKARTAALTEAAHPANGTVRRRSDRRRKQDRPSHRARSLLEGMDPKVRADLNQKLYQEPVKAGLGAR